MSSVQSFSNSQSFNGKVGSWTYKNFDKNSLYPNSTAKPYQANFSISIWRDWYIVSQTVRGKINYNGTEKCSINTSSSQSTKTDSTSSTGGEVTGYNKGSATIQLGYYGSSNLMAIDVSGTVTHYFYRYDFSATAGTGVTSASVSSSTGYDGDKITFSCVIPTGYVFDGWYNGNTKVSSSQSYTHTVNGADLTLTAKAHQQTHNVNGTYNGSTKAILTGITGDVGVSYNGKTKTMPTDATEFTLGEKGKAMHTDVVVGSAAPLQCAEKLMRSPLVIKYV